MFFIVFLIIFTPKIKKKKKKKRTERRRRRSRRCTPNAEQETEEDRKVDEEQNESVTHGEREDKNVRRESSTASKKTEIIMQLAKVAKLLKIMFKLFDKGRTFVYKSQHSYLFVYL